MTRNVRKKSAPALLDQIVQSSAETSDMARSTVLGRLIREERSKAIEQAMAKTSDGFVLSRMLSDITDEAIKGLYVAGAAVFPDEARHLSVLAVGGYGRRRLAPFSDIDLLVLHSAKAGQSIKPLLDFILYALWDAGLTVGQTVHSPSTALNFVKEDVEGCTSFLDARPLIGNDKLSGEFITRFDKYRQQSAPGFVEAKLAERDARIALGQNSRYIVEPDIKEGKGGLRDVQTLHWLAKYAYGPLSNEEMIRKGVFTEEDVMAFDKALAFLWSVRFQLHVTKGRADEQLSFDVQPIVAEKLGYKDRKSSSAAERLMKHYFLNAREVGRMTGIISTALEDAQVKKSRLFDGTFLGVGGRQGKSGRSRRIRADEFGAPDAFVLKGDRLNFADPAHDLQKNTLDILRLFRIAGRAPACEIHPDALRSIAEIVPKLRPSDFKDEDHVATVKAIILDTENPESVLRDMSELGVLGKCFPAFAMLIGRVVYGLYRRFTVDEHVLKSIGVLNLIHRGEDAEYNPVSTKIMQETDMPLHFYLAILMHETAYALPQPDQQKVERKVRSSLAPYIDNKNQLDDVVWVASHHKIMAHTATRRNIMETRTVSQFAETVGTIERLNLLIVLTVSHLRVAGINSWDKWTRRDISVLYDATAAWFRGGEAALRDSLKKRRDALRSKTARKLKEWPVTQLDRFFGRLSDGFFEGVNPDSAARFAKLLDKVDRESEQGDVVLTVLEEGMVEAIVYSRDKPGLYANVAGAIAQTGGTIRASAAFPVKAVSKGADMAANIFIFESDEITQAVLSKEESKLIDRFQALIREGIMLIDAVPVELPARVGDRREDFDVPSVVTLDSETSEDCLIVEARGLDRPGLLNNLTATLSDIGISIRSAHVATYGEIAVDTFYVQDMPGYKITNKRRQEMIKRRILSVLNGN
jgi:[protein-PII] uridylyltransferase